MSVQATELLDYQQLATRTDWMIADPRPLGKMIPPAEPTRLTVLVPAHNEETTIGNTLDSLWQQNRPPERIIVIADNCTDRTAEIARSKNAEVFETIDNTFKKAGGLNQALRMLLPTATDSDAYFVMDADTVIVPGFLEVAMAKMDAGYDAVGGVFYGEGGSGLLGALQRNEYIRYCRDIARHKGRVLVLTGTGSIFRAHLMQQIAAQRGTAFPGNPGQVYDTISLTEDNEITLASKTLGAKMVSPNPCRTITEVMPTWRDLWKQRMRWQRGALENIRAYGITRTTARYWFQQIGLGWGTIALNAYLFLMLLTLASLNLHIMWFWAAFTGIFVAERVITAWKENDWQGRGLAAVIVIELGYDLFQQAVYVKSLFDLLMRREATWHHVDRSAELAKRNPLRVWAIRLFPLALVPLVAVGLHLISVVVLVSTVGITLEYFVAANTLFYAVLSICKIVPRKQA